jgi:hypothetical protein
VRQVCRHAGQLESDFLLGNRDRIRKTKVTTSHETITLSQVAGQVTVDLTGLSTMLQQYKPPPACYRHKKPVRVHVVIRPHDYKYYKALERISRLFRSARTAPQVADARYRPGWLTTGEHG